MSKDILRLGKCYQGKSPFIFWPILSPRSAGEKLFLLISAGEKKTRAIRMITEKEKPSPELLRDGASFSSLLRKYVPKAIIKGVREDLGGDIWIPLFEHSEQEQANWFILIRFESPGEISLISVEKQETLIRIGPKGSFTHRKALHFPVPSADDLKLISFHSVDRVEELFHQETRKDSQETEDKSVPKEKLATKEHESLNPMLREARQKLSRRVRTLRKACERLETSLVKPEDVAKLRAQAEALQNFAYLLKGGEKELLIKPLEENRGEEWLIPLDESLSTGANIQHYFKRVKKAETTESTTTAVWRKARSELESAEGALDKLRAQDEFPENEVLALLKRQGLSLEPAVKQQRREQDSGQSHFRTFHSLSSNALLLVGKGPADNDLLTKSAQANDFWVHVVTGSGSHVLVPKRILALGKNETLAPSVQREAAILAVHFSKLRANRSGEVYFTERRFLKKKKGMADGLWSVEKSKNFHVDYEEDELKKLLSSTGESGKSSVE